MAESLLDTSVLIDIDAVDLGHHRDDQVLISAVTVGELAFGVDIPDPVEARARELRLRAVIENYEILPFGVEEAKLYGVLATLVRVAGRNPRPRRLDLQIAATAAASRVQLLTCNPKDFVGIDRLVNVIPVRRVS